jgi:hypothetical protein
MLRKLSVVFLTGLCACAIPAAAQTTDPRPSRISTSAAHPATPYLPPRTAWGDPDLQGTYTNKYELNTPLERPKAFEGRRVEDITAAELAEIIRQRQEAAVNRPAGPGGNPQFRDVYEVAKGSRLWLIVDPPTGKMPPLRPDARDRATPAETTIYAVNERWPIGGSSEGGPFNSPEDFSLYDRCVTRGLPGSMLPHVQGNSYEIFQAPGLVAIRYEMIHETRVIPLDPRPHVGPAIRLDMGDARGHWEGDTLVVETRNFKERSTYRNAMAASLRLVERFTRTAPNRVEWAVTVDDSATWTQPWTFMVPLTRNGREPVMEFACHEGNYAIPHMLEGARAAESRPAPQP